ncbi:MAG: type IV secretion system protein [Sphingomonas sp.]|uniref:type IV secretion system protein n=1 Tax=Sphingomonas sp. TaxID=28214 RepID=UPI0035682981
MRDLLGYVDCQAQTIGASGYQALAVPGSSVSIALTGMLTLFVAAFGYRMLLGQTPSTRDAVLAIVKVGIVLALATSWSAYRTVVYDVALRTPAELAASIGAASALPGANGGLEAHLQAVDDGLAELVRIGTGRPDDAVDNVGQAPQTLTPAQQQQQFQRLGQRPRWDPQRDAELLGNARTIYLTSALGALAAVRLVTGLLLALGPFFALFLLFDATRGVFEGWLRALGGAALGGVTTAIVLAIELAVIEPWLAAILAEREAEVATPAVPIELLALSLVFALTLLAGLIAAAKIAHGFRIPVAVRAVSDRLVTDLQTTLGRESGARRGTAEHPDTPERSRALAIADAAATAQRRETVTTASSSFGRMDERGNNPQTPARGPTVVPIVPIGQSARRRTTARVSAGANRREAL